MRGSLPQITQIYTDVAQEKICDNPWNPWENILSSSMRRSLPQITQIYTDIGCGEKDTNHTDVAQEKICDNPWNLWENILKKHL